ncbi:tetratricopeptide repeat-containing sensor histidine kinase [Ferruginibacter sp.]
MPSSKKYLLAFCLFFFFHTAFAQNAEKIAAINAKLSSEKTDSNRVMLLNDLFVQYREYDSAKAMEYVNQATSLAHKIGFDKGESLLLLNKGVFLNLNGENDEAEKLINQSLNIRVRINDFSGQGYCLRSLGNIQYDKNDYTKALEYYLAAAPKFEKANDLKGLSGDYIWVGNVFNEGLHQFNKAVEYFDKSLVLAKQLNDSSLMSYDYNNLGQAYYFAKNYDSALYYYRQSRQLKELLEDDRGLGNAFSNISNVFFDRKEYDSAAVYNTYAFNIRQKQNDKKGMATSYSNGANIYLQQKNYTAAFEDYNKAIALGNEIGFKEPVIESYNGLSQYYEIKGDTKLALEYYKKYKLANDSIFNSGISQQLSTLQTKYETTKKQQLINEQQFELTKKQYWIYGSAGLLALVCLLSYSYYRRYKLKQEKRLQVEVMRQQDLSTKAVIVAEENERRRIAADLHDGVGQMMSAAKMNLSAFENDIPFKDDQQKISFEKIINLVDESCKEIRSVSHQMMPNALLKSGLASAIKEFIDKIDTRVLKVNLHTEGLNERLDGNVETVLYRVIQECVNNVIKHSGANSLDISLIKDTDGIAATIEDNGKGFNITNKENIEGIGLKNIRSRIEFLKGTVDFDSSPGNGTLVAIHVPLV